MQAILDAKRDQITEAGRTFNKLWDPQPFTPGLDHSFNIDFNKKMKWGNVDAGNITTLTYSNNHLKTDMYVGQFIFRTTSERIDTNFSYNDQLQINQIDMGLLHNWSFLMPNGTLLEFRNLFNQLGLKKYTRRVGFDWYRLANVLSHELNYQTRATYSGQLGASHDFSETFKVDGTFGFAYASRKRPDIRRIYSLLDENPTSEFEGKYRVAIANQATPDQNGRLFLWQEERIWTATANMSKELDFGGWMPEVKTGIYYETRNRTFRNRNIGYVKGNQQNFIEPIAYIQPYSEIYADSNINFPNGLAVNERTSPRDKYDARNDLLAAYLTLNIPVGARLNIYGGVRMEANTASLTNFYGGPQIDSIDINIDTVNFFPSVNISYDLSEKTKLRLAYGMTINRPEFREMSPFAFNDFENSAQMYGNPDIQNAYIHNYDIRFEWYPRIGELVTIGAFYKDFLNPIELTQIPASTDKWTFIPQNVKEAESYGIEVDIKKSLYFLENSANFLRNLRFITLVFNASRIWSTVNEERPYVYEKERPLAGQSPYIVNAGLYYDHPEIGLTASLLYNVFGERIIFVGTPNNPHSYQQPMHDLEFSFKKRIGEHFTVTGGFENILDWAFEITQTIQADSDGDEVADFSEDRILRQFKPNRKISLGVSYTF
jgi:TonB-dependent receptor